MKVLYDWLKDYVGETMPPIKELEELFTFHAFEIDGVEEVSGKTVIDVKVLPDRAGDCLSHRGIARELSALTGTPLVHDPLFHTAELLPGAPEVTVTIENGEYCRRFGLAVMKEVVVGESPLWLQERLAALGQRSINNVVDATNYVMLALGQPLHAYDADKLSENGEWHFGVRMAKEGEEVTILGGEIYTLTADVQLIVNGTDVPVGIAGIKGGKAAEVDRTTKNILIEAANFDPQITRRASQVLRLQTDASKRFENDISPEIVSCALKEVVSLIEKIAGGSCVGFADSYPTKEGNGAIPVTLAHIKSLLGVTIEAEKVENILSRLGFSIEKGSEGWTVTAPFERRDIIIPEDVIAEIGRVYGYEHVKSVVPETVPLTEINARHYYSEKIREFLLEEGFSEVITSSFRKKDDIELQNALASDKGCIRSSLRGNITEVLDRNMPNLDLLGVSDIRVFEIGTVFSKRGGDVIEHTSLTLGVRTKQQGYTPTDDGVLQETIQKMTEALGTAVSFDSKSGVAELNLTELLPQLPVPSAYDPYRGGKEVTFVPYSIYPFISRDIALWMPETVTASSVEELLQAEAGELLVRIALFDEFKKEGRISYAFRLVFQSFERTLTDEEVGEIMGRITELARGKGFEVR